MELLKRGIRDAEKKFFTETNANNKREQEFSRRVQFLKDSEPYIVQKNGFEAKLKEIDDERDKAQEGLPEIKKQLRAINLEIDAMKKIVNVKKETHESFSKELEAINVKRQKARDERDRLFKEKNEIRDKYYTDMIHFSKQQQLVHDIKWMTEMQGKIKAREAEK